MKVTDRGFYPGRSIVIFAHYWHAIREYDNVHFDDKEKADIYKMNTTCYQLVAIWHVKWKTNDTRSV